MKHSEVLRLFGSGANTALCLGVTRQAVNLWRYAPGVPEARQKQIHALMMWKLGDRDNWADWP